jgi:hypothetical protein
MRTTILSTLLATTAIMAFGNTVTLTCTPTALTNAAVVGNAVDFNHGVGTGSFTCSDSSLGALTLNSVSVNLSGDYQFGNGMTTDPNDNSAGFTFTNAAATWAVTDPGSHVSTMALNTGSGVTLFTIGNLSSVATSYTNTTSGGLTGTTYFQPAIDPMTGSLLGNFTINTSAFVDAGGFTNGSSSAQVAVTYNYTPSGVPEPSTVLLAGAGLLVVGLVARKRLITQSNT